MKPPRLGTWLLGRLGPGNSALTGDLLEEWQHGRTRGWYWRQVVTAIRVGATQQIAAHRLLMVRALLVGWGFLWLAGPGNWVQGWLYRLGLLSPGWLPSSEMWRVHLRDDVLTLLPVSWTYQAWPFPRVGDIVWQTLVCGFLVGAAWIVVRLHRQIPAAALWGYVGSFALFSAVYLVINAFWHADRYWPHPDGIAFLAVELLTIVVKHASYASAIVVGGLLAAPTQPPPLRRRQVAG